MIMENLEVLAKIHVYHPVECLVNIYITSTQECYCNYDSRVEHLIKAFKEVRIEALEEAAKMCNIASEEYGYDADPGHVAVDIKSLIGEIKEDK